MSEIHTKSQSYVPLYLQAFKVSILIKFVKTVKMFKLFCNLSIIICLVFINANDPYGFKNEYKIPDKLLLEFIKEN